MIGRFVNDENIVSSDEYTFDLEVINNILIEEIVASDMIIPINYNGELDYSILPNTATNQNLMYQVSDNEILEINDGIITAKKNGTTSILISTQDGSEVTKTINVTVDDPKLNYDITNIVGDTNTSLDTLYTMYDARIDGKITSTLISDYSIHVVLNDNIDADAYFHLNTIGDNFTLTADKTMTVPGTYTIVVTGTDVNGNTVEGVSTNNTFIIYEVSPVTGLNAGDIAFDLDDEIVIPYEITPLGASNYNVLFEIISGDDIISVAADGKMKGLKTGDASLKISSKENPDINKVINVYVRNVEVELYNYSIIGDYNVNTNVIYESYGGKLIFNYNESDVNEIALKVTSSDGSDISSMFTYAADVVVDPINANTIKRLTVNVPSSLDAGEYSISLIGKYVDDSGKIASSGSDTYDFSVLENVLVEEITGDDMYIPLDFNGKINYNVSPNNVVNNGVTFSNYDDSIISVSDDGMITAHSLGETTVTIKAKDKGQKTGTVKVIVTEPYFSYEITSIEGDYYINPNAIYQFQSGTIYGKINPILTSEFDIKVEYINGTDASSLFDFDIDEENNTFEIAVDDSKALAQEYTIIMTGKDKNGNVVTGTSTNNSFTILNNTLINSIEADDITMLVGDVKNLTYDINNDALNKDVDVSIKDGFDVITLDESLNITGLKSGVAHILIKAKDASNLEKVVTVKVVEASANMVIDNIVGDYDLDTSKIYEHKTGTILGHVDCVDINEASFKIYKDDNLIESGFDIQYESIGDVYSYTIGVGNVNDAGTYKIVFEGDYLYNDSSISKVKKSVVFLIDENILIDSVLADDIYLTNGDSKLLIKDEYYLISPSNVTNDKIIFEVPVEYSDVISVDDDGLLTAKSVGDARVNIIAYDSSEVKCVINVHVSDISVSLDFIEEGNEDDYLDTSRIYENVGGKLIFNTALSDEELTVNYYVYDINGNDVTNMFGFDKDNEDAIKALIVPSYIEAGIFKVVVTATTNDETPVTVSDYEFFTVYQNILVKEIEASDVFLSLDESQELKYNIISSDADKSVTNDKVEVIVDDDEIVSYDESLNMILGKKLGSTTITIKSKDAGHVTKVINVNVIDLSIDAQITSIIGNYDVDTSKLFAGHGGIVKGSFAASDYNNLTVKVLENDVEVADDLYEFIINENEFELNVFEGLSEGNYKLKITISNTMVAETVSKDALLEFEVYKDIKVSSIESDDVYLDLDDDNKSINYVLQPQNITNTNVEFINYDDSVVSIDSSGKIIPKKVGSTGVTIRAKDGSDVTSVININVVDVNINLMDVVFNDVNGNSINSIFSGNEAIVNGNISVSGQNTDLKVNIYSSDDELVNSSFDGIVIGSNSVIIPISSTLDADNYRAEVIASYVNDGVVVSSSSVSIPITILDPALSTSINLIESSLLNDNGSVVDALNYGMSGSFTASYKVVNGTDLSLSIYYNNVDVTSLFDDVDINNNSLSFSIPNDLQSGTYQVIIVASLIIDDSEVSSAQLTIPFVVSSGTGVDDIIADDLSIKLGESVKLNYQPSDLSVIFIVNDSSVIDIDDSGNVIPKKVGQTSVTIRSALDSSVSKTINVVVYDDNLNDIGYTVLDDMISDIDPSTDLSTLVSNITKNNNVQVRIYTSNNVLRTSGIVATGDIIEIVNGESVKRFEAVVPGDASGDGRITALDYIAIRNHIMGSNTITKNAFVKAADYSKDNKISALDYIAIRNYIMKGAN